MNYDNLTKSLLEQVPELVKKIKETNPPPGIFDLTLTATATDEATEVTEVTIINVELVELTDRTWVLEGYSTKQFQYDP